MIVMKFGGTSMGSAERIDNVATIALQGGSDAVVVVSAMAGTTDELLSICSLIRASHTEDATRRIDRLHSAYTTHTSSLLATGLQRSLAHETIDAYFREIREIARQQPFTQYEERNIVSYGERMSSAMLYYRLQERGANAELADALKFMRLQSNGKVDMQHIRSHFPPRRADDSSPHIIVTQGFICRNAYGEVANLERGGSDYTATLIGSALQADQIQIWTDISGLHTTDPRSVDNTQRVPHLCYDEAIALAYNGAKILHPICVEPAKEAEVPIILLNTMRPEDEGTTIDSHTDNIAVKAIAAKEGMQVMTLRRQNSSFGWGSGAMWQCIGQYRQRIHLLHLSHTALMLCVENWNGRKQLIEHLQEYGQLTVEDNLTVVTIVGRNITSRLPFISDVAAKALGGVPARLITSGECPHTYTIIIPSSQKTPTLKSLHKLLFQ